MFSEFLLIAILIAPDGVTYNDSLFAFDNATQCEAAKAQWVKSISVPDLRAFTYSAICVRPRAVGSTDA